MYAKKRVFIDVIAHHCLTTNQFLTLQKVILHFDPRIAGPFLDVLKEFLKDRGALDILYSYEVFTKDYVNAGLLAIRLFVHSLEVPMNYRI